MSQPGPTSTPVLNGIPAPGNTFVVPDAKIMYVSVTKVACTSLRWMIADLAGEDLESFYDAPSAHQTRLMTIHRERSFWKLAPQLGRAPATLRAEISPDNGWLVFAVVRDPWSRLWSAWQSKFLVRHTPYVRHYEQEPWFPRPVTSQEGVVEDFARFVEAAPWRSHLRLRDDRHFRPQVDSVAPSGIAYSRIYDLDRLDELFDDLHTHLQGLGMDRELYLPRANETPLPLIRPVYPDALLDRVEELYAADVAAFGDRWDRDTIRFKGESWTADALEHAAYHGLANERIGDLSATVKRLQRELAAQRAEGSIGRLSAHAARLKHGPLRDQVRRALGR